MRTSICLSGIVLTAAALGMGAMQVQAAQPAGFKQVDCRGKEVRQGGAPCAIAKPMRTVERVSGSHVVKAALNHGVCGRLQTKLERDTCLNRVEATA